MINRFILWLSLAGMILALHLWIQKARGFDQGCLGLSKPQAVAQGGCLEVSDLPASHLLGVSNAAWGYAFYFGLALVSALKLSTRPGWAARLHMIGEGGTALAFVYSGYLVYRMGSAGAWCVLCIVSAMLVAGLFTLHGVLRAQGGYRPADEPERTAEFRAAVGAMFAAFGVLVGVVVFVDRLGTRPLEQGSTGLELERIVGRALPIYIDGEKLREMRACHLDWSARAIEPANFIGPETPSLGKPGGMPVIFFYDPNCGFCREEHPMFTRLAEKFGERAQFYAVPCALWDYSLPQVAALKLAERSGKYFELWDRMFERQPRERRGMPVPEIAAIFQELGLDASNLEKRLEALRPEIVAQRERERKAGINGAPFIYINGRRVWGLNRSPECVGTLIERRLRVGAGNKRQE